MSRFEAGFRQVYREDGGIGRRARFRFQDGVADVPQDREIIDTRSHVDHISAGEIVSSRSDVLDVETALAKAIDGATSAGRFDVVAQLCKELEARRLARAGNVVAIDSKRSKG